MANLLTQESSAESNAALRGSNHTDTPSSLLGSPIDTLPTLHARESMEPGDYWLVNKDGMLWPVIICDEPMVIKFLGKKGKRPSNARLPDGSWPDKVLAHGMHAGQKCFPVLLLGIFEFVWKHINNLRKIDWDFVWQEATNPGTDLRLKRAYEDYLIKEDLNHWKVIANSRLKENDLADRSGLSPLSESSGEKNAVSLSNFNPVTLDWSFPPDSGAKAKFNQQSIYQYHRPPMNDLEDDDEGYLFRKTTVIKKEPGASSMLIYGNSHGRIYEVSDAEDSPAQKRMKFGQKESKLENLQMSQEITRKHVDEKIGLDMVKVYVGNPPQIFLVKRSGTEQSLMLQNAMKFQAGEYNIMSPALLEIKPAHFVPIREYLERGEYTPVLLHDGTDYAILENVVDRQETSEVIYQSATIYLHAQTLQLVGLMNLAVRKFKAVAPYDPENFILMANLFYESGRPEDPDLHVFMIDYIVKHFWSLWKEKSESFRELLQDHDILMKDVFAKMGWKVEVEEEDGKVAVKSEEVEEALFIELS